MDQVTEAEFARMHGVSREAVRQWKDEGRITMTGDLVHVATSDGMLQASRRGRFRTKRKPSSSRRQLTETVSSEPTKLTREELFEHAAAYPLVSTLSICIGTPGDLYLALLPHLPPATARPLVERFVAQMRVGAVECLEGEVDPPPGFTSWADHPWFADPPMTADDWTEIEEEHRRG
ncbi:MAG: hypothetical protein EON48_01905 [Acetobacteraceae bacterium]|nr:MAG: hypothetical protein EON48_01905 [Acetobacteraceae bacterium]